MKSNRRMILGIVWIVLGASLLGANLTGLLGDYWGGLGGGLMGVGVVQTIRNIRYLRSAEYREKVNTTNQDERNRFLANKAWAWAGYCFVMICGVGTIALRIAGKEMLSMACAWAVCFMLVLYWVCYLIISKKY